MGAKRKNSEESNIFDDLEGFVSKVGISEVQYVVNGSVLCINTSQLTSLYVEWKLQTARELLSREAVRRMISNVPGFVTHSHSMRLGGKIRRCSVFFVNEIPQKMREMLGLEGGDDE